MKNKKILIIFLIVVILITIGYFAINNYLSNYMFEEGQIFIKSRKQQLTEIKQNINNNILDEAERIDFINNCLKQEMITPDEADFLLGKTDKL